MLIVITLERDAMQSAVMPQHCSISQMMQDVTNVTATDNNNRDSRRKSRKSQKPAIFVQNAAVSLILGLLREHFVPP